MAKRKVEVTFDVLSTVSRSELREFITEALSSAGGSRHPGDPLFDSLRNVKVRFVPVEVREPA